MTLLAPEYTESMEAPSSRTSEESKLSLDALARMLSKRRTGVSGPAPRDMEQYVAPHDVLSAMDNSLLEVWPAAMPMADKITHTINKLASREGVEPGETVAQEVAHKLEVVGKLSGFPSAKTELLGIEKVTLNFTTEGAAYYLGGDFIEDLTLLASSSPKIQAKIGDFFTIYERLRRVSVDREAIHTTRESVGKAVEIANDTSGYLEKIAPTLDETARDKFAASLSAHNILVATTKSPVNTEEAIVHAAQIFSEMTQRFPLMAEHMPEDMTTLILQRGGSGTVGGIDIERLMKYAAQKEHALEKGLPAHVARMGSNEAQTNRSANKHQLRKASSTNNKKALEELPDAAFDINYATHGISRDVLLRVVRNDRLTDFEKRSLFDALSAAALGAEQVAHDLPDTNEGAFREAFQGAITEAIAKWLGVVDDLTQRKVKYAQVQHVADRVIGAVDSIRPVMDAALLAGFAFNKIHQAHALGAFNETGINVKEGVARFVHEQAGIAVTLRPEGDVRGERRLAYKVYITPEEQMSLLGVVYDDKKNASFDIRIDEEDTTHQLSFDFGGLNGEINTLFARVVTASRQHHAQQHGGDVNDDYHMRRQFEGVPIDSGQFKSFLVQYMYSLNLKQ